MGVKILFFLVEPLVPEKGGQNSIFFPSALKKGGQNRGAYQPTSLKGCPPRGLHCQETVLISCNVYGLAINLYQN